MRTRPLSALAAALLSALLFAQCGGSAPPGPTPPGGGGGTPPPTGPVTVLAAGDIGECGFGAPQTGLLLDRLEGTILALGDLAYFQGTAANFRDCYDPFWGRHRDRTRPVPGNHEYESPGASPYYDYFGSLAGPRGLGYYAFTAGSWRIIALNSELPMTPASAQQQWLRGELDNNRFSCTLAYWHRPLFSSGPNPPALDARDLWRTLSDSGVDLILNGHDHLYERFAPQDVDGKASSVGIRQFTAGTGGAHLYVFGAPKPNSEKRASVYGLLALTLSAGAYQWDFKSVGNTFSDTGTDTCH